MDRLDKDHTLLESLLVLLNDCDQLFSQAKYIVNKIHSLKIQKLIDNPGLLPQARVVVFSINQLSEALSDFHWEVKDATK